jgi:uncharacterized 2Fe-2S/4Fe-4S cluster protein (DUF4445 family)
VRLACQVTPEDDLEVTIINRALPSAWRHIASPSLNGADCGSRGPYPASLLPKGISNAYGVAVDLGTTHISLSFFDLLTGEWLAGRQGMNPQAEYGADIMTRLGAARESRRSAEAMRKQAIEAIGQAIVDVAVGEGIRTQDVARLVLVGNTAMLGLLSGRNYPLLLDPAHWTSRIDCAPEKPKELAREWELHEEAVPEIVPALAGFVGSDLSAGIIATSLCHIPGSLLIDFGTNSEVALWDGKDLWVTSAAGGPAFEGCGISCGMGAEPGAIFRARSTSARGQTSREPTEHSFVPEKENPVSSDRSACRHPSGLRFDLRFETLEDEKPAGFCGSGLVDLIASLVRAGKLSATGRFTSGIPGSGLVVLEGEPGLTLTKRDVDVFQRAKGAVQAGVRVLLSKAGMSREDLRRVYVGGAFGRFLDLESAAAVGLLPDMSHEAIQLCGNTALAGCEALLMRPGSIESLEEVAARARIINLAQCDEFEDLFLEGLYLRRWPYTDCDGIG